jgi:hypothetical protein
MDARVYILKNVVEVELKIDLGDSGSFHCKDRWSGGS